MDYIRKEFHIIRAPQSPTKSRMVSPEQFIKFQIKSQLHMAGLPEGKSMDELVDEIFEAVFNSDTLASIRDVMFEIREQEKLMEA